jgi:hypothetical protein
MTCDASQDHDQPLCDRAEFDEEMAEMVAEEAPRLFAVVQERGERVDGWIAAWGMAFNDHVEVVRDGGLISFGSAERVCWLFGLRQGVTAHLVWVGPAGAS